MKTLPFFKFHGTGNDFILIDNRTRQDFNKEQISAWCNRHTGVGADGFILLEEDTETDFLMRYFNADGKEASLCGNGSRCAIAFAHSLKMIENSCTFRAFDGIHRGVVIHHAKQTWHIALEMMDVSNIISYNDGYFIDTGSPHFVTIRKNLNAISIYAEGKSLRNDARFPEGANINFIMPYKDGIFVRTYERGVEDETLSCGTGVTASAIIWSLIKNKNIGKQEIPVYTQGGNLRVTFEKIGDSFCSIYLEGPAVGVFKGEIYR